MAIPAPLMLIAISNVRSDTGIFSLSKSAISAGLDASEYALLVFGVLLAVGIIGEYAKSEKWKSRKRIFEIIVIVGVGGEIFADGGIFLFSRNLQTISDHEVAVLNEQAEKANELAKGFQRDIEQAKKDAAEANRTAEQEHLARVRIEERLKDRSLNKEQQRRIEVKLKVFSGTPYELALDPLPEALSLLTTIDAVLRSSGWSNHNSARTDFRSIFTLPSGSKAEEEYVSGIVVRPPQSHSQAGEALIRALKAENLAVERESLRDDDPSPNNIHVVVGSK